MLRQFDERARLTVYLEKADLDKMRAMARSKGQLFAEWARETLLRAIAGKSKVREK